MHTKNWKGKNSILTVVYSTVIDLGIKLLCHVWLLCSPMDYAHQAPLSKGFLRQEHWSGLPVPFQGYLPDPGIEPPTPALSGGFFTSEP